MYITKSQLKYIIKEEASAVLKEKQLHEATVPAPGSDPQHDMGDDASIESGRAGSIPFCRTPDPRGGVGGTGIGQTVGTDACRKWNYERGRAQVPMGAKLGGLGQGQKGGDRLNIGAIRSYEKYLARYPELGTGRLEGISGNEKNLRWLQSKLDIYVTQVKREYNLRTDYWDRQHEVRNLPKGSDERQEALIARWDIMNSLHNAMFEVDKTFASYINVREMFRKATKMRSGPGFPAAPQGAAMQQKIYKTEAPDEALTDLGYFYRLLKQYSIKQPEHLTKYGQDFTWGPEHQRAYNELVKRMEIADEAAPQLDRLKKSVLYIIKKYK